MTSSASGLNHGPPTEFAKVYVHLYTIHHAIQLGPAIDQAGVVI
jgi:hypothetical protein